MLVIFVLAVGLIFTSEAFCRTKKIYVGINAPMPGALPTVGKDAKYAAELWLSDIKTAGGLKVGGETYKVELVLEDNESKADSAVKITTKMITEDEVLVIVGPQSSKQAVPAGEVANNYKTPMISPWSTNPNTFSGPLPSPSARQLHKGRIWLQKSGRALRCCQRLSQRFGRRL